MADDDGGTVPTANITGDPSCSSAALCIGLSLNGVKFHPSFTHQCFGGEYIRGYVPASLRETTPYHASHVHHAHAKHALSISVELAPSCQTCRVAIETEKKQLLPTRRPRKRTRLTDTTSGEENKKNSDTDDTKESNDNEEEEEEEESSYEEEVEEEESSYEDSDVVDEDELENSHADQEGSTRKRRMPVAEIRECLQKALPNMVDHNVDDEYLRRPIGTPLTEYSRNGHDFCLTLATGREAEKYHTQAQKLALWFIETADDVHVADESEGYWRVLYLFRKHTRCQYSLVGYLTLYHFCAPFRKPIPGTVVRICQALILPPYQQSGHGQVSLQAAHDLVDGVFQKQVDVDAIVEINVEDPAPAFTSLRNRVDFGRLLHSDPKPSWMMKPEVSVDESFFATLSESDAVSTATQFKITQRQVHICHELYKLACLKQSSVRGKALEELEKRYRLLVKKRLNREHREELSGCRSKQEMQARLSELFDETYQQYQRILAKSKREIA